MDESVIPDTGRDVQCSNCGHAWFQSPATAELPEAKAAVEEAAAPRWQDDGDSGAEAGAASDGEAADAGDAPEALDIVQKADKARGRDTSPGPDEADTPDVPSKAPDAAAEDDSDDGEDEVLPVAPKPELRRRKLDDAVLGVLREEAERETRVRKVEEAALESQPDLGLAAVAAANDGKTRDRVVRVRGDEDDLDDDALTSRASRRELLPDIEEIKSTLTATSERGDEPAAVDAPETLARRQQSGFRRGFLTTLILAFGAVLIYVLAPAISNAVPALEPSLTAYVEGVNAARIWLDVQMQSLTESLKESTGGA
ncbi:zinc-ribbon domain-containing protein [Albidovulum sp.]|uniref:zinc-ribbon domain-containing protein n=1 Tax=Albidovulum sp. TaxID=1872424 RepID=UPI003D7D8D83